MKKITLLGDSIRQIGYGAKVAELLSPEYTVFQPEENCRFSKYTLWGITNDWKPEMNGSQIVHWNNGLWDSYDCGYGPFCTIEEYVTNMQRIAEILLREYGKVIFANITPVTEQSPTWTNERILRYNEVIVPKMEEMGLIINDLHSLVYPNIDTFISKEDHVHLTPPGIEACAAQVAELIRKVDQM